MQQRYLLMFCDRSGRLVGAAVIESSLSERLVRAAAEGLDPDLTLRDVHQLEPESAALIPSTAIGRVLRREEIAGLIRQIGATIPKTPAAPSVKRTGPAKRQAN